MRPIYFIREAQLTDFGSLGALFEELDEHHRLIRPDLFRKPQGHRRDPAALDRLISSKENTILVADAYEHGFLGLAVLTMKTSPESIMRESRRYVELIELVVTPSVRRFGVGRALIESSKEWVQSLHLAELDVTVWSFNAEAIAFYREVGFQPQIERFTMTLK